MFQLIKTNKFDDFFKKLFVCTLFTYAVFLEVSESTLNDILVVETIVSVCIRTTFILVFSICGYNFFRGKYTIKELIVGMSVFIPIAISFYVGRHPVVLLVLAYVYASKGCDVEKNVKYVLIALIIAYVVIVLSRVFGISKEAIFKQMKYGQMKNRYSFGFGYTCVGTIYFLFITIIYIYLRKNKFSVIEAIVILLINILLYLLTFTRNNFYFIILIVIFAFFMKYNENTFLYKVFGMLTVISPILGSIIIYVLTRLYGIGVPFAIKFNSFVTGRLHLTNDAFVKYGISLFGNPVDFIGGAASGTIRYNYVDSAYMQYLIQYGLIVFIILLVYFTFLSYKAYKFNNKWVLICFFIINYHAVFDDRLLNITLNPFLLLFLPYLALSCEKK